MSINTSQHLSTVGLWREREGEKLLFEDIFLVDHWDRPIDIRFLGRVGAI